MYPFECVRVDMQQGTMHIGNPIINIQTMSKNQFSRIPKGAFLLIVSR
jgi:hypothetical protein